MNNGRPKTIECNGYQMFRETMAVPFFSAATMNDLDGYIDKMYTKIGKAVVKAMANKGAFTVVVRVNPDAQPGDIAWHPEVVVEVEEND